MNRIERLIDQIDNEVGTINNTRLRIKLCQEILNETRQILDNIGTEDPSYGFHLTRLQVCESIERDLTLKLGRLIA